MANKIYPLYKTALMTGLPNVNLLSGAVKTIMIHVASYTYSDAHQFLSDIPGGAQISISGALASKSVVNGAFLSGTGRCTSVSGLEVEAIVLFIDTGSPATSPLVAYLDTGITGLPVTPAGASYNLIPDATGWFIL